MLLINGHTTSISNLSATSTTILNNLNSLSTSSILSINNINATSTTILTNLNSFSSTSMLLINGHTTSISNLNASTTTLFTTKQNNLTFSNPLLNTTNTISLKYDATKLNIDASGNLTVISGTSQWTTTGTSIFYNGGNVGIGTGNPLSLLEIINTNYLGPLLTLDTGIGNATTQMPRAIGQPLIRLGKSSYSTTAGDYYGIGFGYASALTDKNCCEIGCIIGDKTGYEYGD